MMPCKRCGCDDTVKHGVVRNKQRYCCKQCGYHFVSGDQRVKESVAVKKALAVILYSLGKASFGMLGKLFGHSRALTYRWIAEEAARLPDPVIANDIKEMEFDEMWNFIGSKKTRSGSSKTWIVAHGELVAWVTGGRDAATFRRLYDKVKHLTECVFYTDDWDAFAKVLPADRHVIGKAHTITIEQDNSNTRHHLGRMTRRTKVVSKKVEMLDASIKLWLALTEGALQNPPQAFGRSFPRSGLAA